MLPKIRVLLVDDHFVLRRGLASSLGLERDFAIVAEAGNGEDALARYREHRPDLVTMDWALPRMTGPEATAALRAEFPDAKVLLISALENEEHIHAAMQAGALGYVFKSAERADLLAAIRAVAAGDRWLPSGMAARLTARQRLVDVSPREREVLGHIARGASNKQIGDALGISEGTVKIHITHILAKLDAKDRAHAATLALQRGLIHPSVA